MMRPLLTITLAACVTAEVHNVDAPTVGAFLENAADKLVILDFYAPWCGHCQRLEPVLTKFAQDHPDVAVAKIDATKRMNERLADAHGADSYPTLRFRRSGSTEFVDYDGARDAEGFSLLAARLQKPAVARLKKYDDKALEKLTMHEPRVAFLLTAPFDENLKEFESVANDLAHMASFALVEDHRNTGLYPGKVGCVAPNASVHRFPGGDLRDWVEKHNEELVSQLGPHNFRRIGLKRMVVAAVVDPEESLAAQGAEALMREAAKGFHADIREAFAFGILDGRRWDEYIATFDLRVSDLPRVLVLDRPAERFFDEYRPPATGDGEVAAAALRNYLRSIARGEAKARYLNWRGFPDRLKRFWAKRKGLVLAGAAVVVLLFVAIGRACAGGDDEAKEKEE
jgi:thiol-disulfide isomerase/thioredoxin